MSKRDSKLDKTEDTAAWLSDPEVIVFAGREQLAVGVAERHGLGESIGTLFGRKKEDVKKEWERVLDQIHFLIDQASTGVGPYQLDEINFQLGFSAEGQIVFVAKAGVTTTISATFKKKP